MIFGARTEAARTLILRVDTRSREKALRDGAPAILFLRLVRSRELLASFGQVMIRI
jgi:hypothetical protein